MKKTYITKVPDKTGVFLAASRIISAHGGNIDRINYNRVIDKHTLFIEVSAPEEAQEQIARELKKSGFMTTRYDGIAVWMVELKIPDTAGGVTPVLEVLDRRGVNIAYASSSENGTPYQYLRLGMDVRSGAEAASVLEELSGLCELRVLDTHETDRLPDGTAFYVNFANELRGYLDLDPHQTQTVLIQANRLMQVLDDQGKSPRKSLDYIRKFAAFVSSARGEGFRYRLSRWEIGPGAVLHLLEPPCGSNTFVWEDGERLFFVDGGYPCFREETMRALESALPDLASRPKEMFLTHVDMDHMGLAPAMDRVFMSPTSLSWLKREEQGEPSPRRRNKKHEPYFLISTIITQNRRLKTDTFEAVGPADLPETSAETEGGPGTSPAACAAGADRAGAGSEADARPASGFGFSEQSLFRYLGVLPWGGYSLDIYEGPGGHVSGEAVAVCEDLRLVFSGDIYVNVKEITAEQKDFNRLAPFLLTGVDEDPALAKRARAELTERFAGYTFCPGHGSIIEPTETAPRYAEKKTASFPGAS
ncbi:MAG: hypothetical protein IJL66_01035 [Lachnospiraceae bacterium]|nr:hypothetical protein [Lachnospiraceae bacterium]